MDVTDKKIIEEMPEEMPVCAGKYDVMNVNCLYCIFADKCLEYCN